MGLNETFGLKIFNNVYLKDYKSFPYQKLSGRKTLLYKGKIICGVKEKPKEFVEKKDLYIDCDCQFEDWKNLKRVF